MYFVLLFWLGISFLFLPVKKLLSFMICCWYFDNVSSITFFFHPLKKNNYANHAFHQDNQDKQPIGLWLKQLSRLKSFGLTQSSISVSRSWNIECPYKLLASESVIYEIAFVSIVRFQEIIISFSVAFTNYRNSTPYRAFNELILSIAENIITI